MGVNPLKEYRKKLNHGFPHICGGDSPGHRPLKVVDALSPYYVGGNSMVPSLF